MHIPPLGLERSTFTYETNPHAAAVMVDTLEWAEEQRFGEVLPGEQVQNLVRAGAGISAHVGPRLSREGLAMVARQCAWLYLYDAPADGEASRTPEFKMVFGAAQDILDHPKQYETSASPFAAALGDIALSVRARTNDGQYERWAGTAGGYIKGVAQEMQYQERGVTPSLADYMRMRRNTSGVRVVLSMIEPAEGITLPEQIWNMSMIPRMTALAVDVVALDNDLISYPKEAAEGRAELSPVTILRRQRNLTEQEAIDNVVTIRNHKEAELLDMERKLRKSGVDQFVLRYIAGIKGWIHGHLQFVDRGARYKSA